MPKGLQADVALIHVAGGATRSTPPPGTIAQAAPRRPARGRSGDLLFLTLRLDAPSGAVPRLADRLAQMASETYFDTPGTVTSALREATIEINQHLLDANQAAVDPTRVQGHLVVGVLRGEALYLSQCGTGLITLVRSGVVSTLSSSEAARRPLGLSVAPFMRFHHFELKSDDRVLLTAVAPPLWSEPLLSGLSALSTTQAVERLGSSSHHDLTGILIRTVHQDQTAPLPSRQAAEVRPKRSRSLSPLPTIGPVGRRTETRPLRESASRFLRGLSRVWEPIGQRLQRATRFVLYGLWGLIVRMAPGLAEPPRPGAFPPAILAATAVAVPLIVVAISSVVYSQRGRGTQFQTFVAQARGAAEAAQLEQDPVAARRAWLEALDWLESAKPYGDSPEANALRDQATSALDSLDLIIRIDFRPVLSGGFGQDASITSLAASSTDLYVLDSSNQIIWRAWSTGRGYEVDSAFECLDEATTGEEIVVPVDLAIQPEPGALGIEGVVAVDGDGTLLYCAPEKRPASSQLSEPDIGWGQIQAIDVFNDRLYVLDPRANSIWIYDATGGLFSGNPVFFFAEDVPVLEDAIDLAMAQDELFILHSDGRVDRCRRMVESTPDGSVRIRSECDQGVSFEDNRPGYTAQDHIPGALPTGLAYSPPPEPSLFFMDTVSQGVYHYSMRMVYQGQFKPTEPFAQQITALALGPPNDLFIATGNQVYYTSTSR